MLRSLLELDGLIVTLWAIGVVLVFAIFVMVLVSHLNNRRERENSDVVLKHTAERLAEEKEKNAELAARAEEAERLHRSDLALIQTRVAAALESMQVASQRAAALPHHIVDNIVAQVIQAGQHAQPWTLPAANGSAAVRQGTARAALTAVPTQERPVRPSQTAAALVTGMTVPGSAEALPSTDGPQPSADFVYKPIRTYEATPEAAPQDAPNAVGTDRFDGPQETQNGDPYDSPEGKDQLSAPPVDDPAVSEDAEHGNTGIADDARHLEPETQQANLTRPQHNALAAVDEPVTQDDSQAGFRVEEDTPAFGLTLPNGVLSNGSGSSMDDDPVAALEKTLNGIRRDSLAFPPSETGMKPVTGEPDPAADAPTE